jgi:outer membrane protein assembly factor BamD (BamD/ComL family)
MTHSNRDCGRWGKLARVYPLYLGTAALTAFFSLAGCTTGWEGLKNVEYQKTDEHFDRSKKFFTAGNYEGAFRESKKVLADGRGPADVALFNMGLISAYSLNPKKDYPTALRYFRTLVQDYPNSLLVEQSKVWIHVLEEHQKIAAEKVKLAEQKRTLTRERELLSQEREKLKYMIEKSRQVDIEIEKRRRRTLMR